MLSFETVGCSEADKLTTKYNYKPIHQKETEDIEEHGKKTECRFPRLYMWRQIKIALCLILNCICFGLGVMWPSPVMVKLANATETVLERPVTLEEESWIVSVMYIGGGFGHVIASLVVDSFGRKMSVIVCGLVNLTSALLLLFASQTWMLICGRLANGISDGIFLGVVPTYFSEIANKEIHGALGVSIQISACLGSVMMLCIGPFVSYFYLNLMQTIIVALSCVPTWFLPDSPNFLYAKGRHEESRKVLIYLRGSEHAAVKELQEYASSNNDQKLSLISVFSNRTFLKSLAKTTFFLVSTYMTLFNCVMSYLQTILITTRTNIKSEYASAVIGGIQISACLCTMLTTDKVGRKPILVLTLSGLAIGMISLGIFFKLREHGIEISGFLNYLPLISLILVVFCYTAGLGSLVWVMLPEMFDNHSRGIGVVTTLILAIPTAFLTVRYFPEATTIFGPPPVFWFSAIFCILLSIFVVFQVPETKGRTFAEIQRVIANK